MPEQNWQDIMAAAVGKEYICPQGCGNFILGNRMCVVGMLGNRSHHPDFSHHCHKHDLKIESVIQDANHDNSPSDR